MPPKRKESTTRKPPGQGRRKKGDYKKPAHDEKTTKVEQTVARWKALLHVVNHGTLHRGQIVAMLRPLGYPAPATDLIFFYLR